MARTRVNQLKEFLLVTRCHCCCAIYISFPKTIYWIMQKRLWLFHRKITAHKLKAFGVKGHVKAWWEGRPTTKSFVSRKVLLTLTSPQLMISSEWLRPHHPKLVTRYPAIYPRWKVPKFAIYFHPSIDIKMAPHSTLQAPLLYEIMNSMKLVIPLHFISWRKIPNDAVTP